MITYACASIQTTNTRSCTAHPISGLLLVVSGSFHGLGDPRSSNSINTQTHPNIGKPSVWNPRCRSNRPSRKHRARPPSSWCHFPWMDDVPFTVQAALNSGFFSKRPGLVFPSFAPDTPGRSSMVSVCHGREKSHVPQTLPGCLDMKDHHLLTRPCMTSWRPSD